MFDNYVWSKGDLTPVENDGSIEGYEIKTNITYYRGIPLSMVHDICVIVDGTPIKREDISFTPDGENWFTLHEMETVTTYKWEYGQEGTVFFKYTGGLSNGNHEITLKVQVRVAYVPVPFGGERTRTIVIDG